MGNEEKDENIDLREKLLNDILSLDTDNPYKQSIIHLQKQFNDGKLNEIQEYLLINGILAAYDMNLYEAEKLEMKRQRELIEKAEKKTEEEFESQLPCVPIQNPDDITEVTIKTNLGIGQILQKGYTQLYKTIGIENLGMKDLKGNPITNLKGGKQKAKAKEIVGQYIDVIKRSDLRRYAIEIADIFEYPRYIEKSDRRGKDGFYQKRMLPLIVYYLAQKNERIIYTTIDELAFFIGLVSKNYKKISIEELAVINPKFTNAMVSQFYCRCKPELERIIFDRLDELKECRALNYYENHCIYMNDGSYYTSSKSEDDLILRTERSVLKEFGTKRIMTIFQRRQQRAFYNRTCSLINEKYDVGWSRYKKQIEIRPNYEALLEILESFIDDNEANIVRKKEIAARFARRITNRTKSDFIRTNKKADVAEDEWIMEQMAQPEITELTELGMDYEDHFREMTKKKGTLNIFRYHDNYLTIQDELIALMISEPEPEIQQEDDIPELKGIM